jgi:hypothetical protein
MVRYIYPAESSQGKRIKIADSDNSKGWKSDEYFRNSAKDYYLPRLRNTNMLSISYSNKIKDPFC